MSTAFDAPALAQPAGAALACQLLASFHGAPVRYCVWKGSQGIEAGLVGDDDLDVLVDRADQQAAHEILERLGFTIAVPLHGRQTPGVVHYYGYDPTSAHLIHIHLYTTLLTGESLILTHHLPFEEMLLADRVLGHVAYVADPAAELAVLVLRTMIKYGSLMEMLWFGDRIDQVRPTLETLLDQTDGETAYRYLESQRATIDAKLFHTCLQELQTGSSLRKRIWLGRAVRRSLRGDARYGTFQWLWQYGCLGWHKLGRCLTKRRGKKRLHRGIVIALVGADATGKSTLLADTQQWLESVFDVRCMHLGKPPSSWLTLPLHSWLPVARRLLPGASNTKQQAASRPTTSSPRSVFHAVRAVTLAWDRHRHVRRVHRAAKRGAIVLCDRYPATQIGAMDCPRLHRIGQPQNAKMRLLDLLARLEAALYQKNPPADLVVKLLVSIDTAQQRNSRREKADKHSDSELRSRHEEFHLWNGQARYRTAEVSTEPSVQETQANVRQTIWNAVTSFGNHPHKMLHHESH